MCVEAIGPYTVGVEYGDGRLADQHLDVGHDGPLRDALPVQLRDVRDLAARYDEVVAFVARQPTGEFTTSDGSVSTFRVRVRSAAGGD